MPKPKVSLLSHDDIEKVHEASLRLLEEVGVYIDNEEALKLLKEEGVNIEGKVAKIPRDLVNKCLKSTPSTFKLYYRDSKDYLIIGNKGTIFNPGSAAIKILDYNKGEPREPFFKDLVDFSILVDALEYINAQSTALVPADVPVEIRDRVRLYPILKFSNKPIITGAFTIEGVHDMKAMLEIVNRDIAKKPIAIFDVCPSPPLQWSNLTMQNLIDCARYGIPVEIIPMPQLGATAPVTLAGALIQHNVEALTGIVIAQLVRRGTPVIYGGSPCLFDMRWGTSCISTPETLLLTLAYTEIGKYYNIPTHAYVGLSDAKIIDYQAGVETLVGALLAVLKGINIASGPGMLEFESSQSMEKIVLDNEICGIVFHIAKGFEIHEETLAIDLIRSVGPGGHFLSKKHTLKWFRIEEFFPKIFDRSTKRENILRKAHERVNEILERHKPESLPPDIERELDKFFNNICKRYGVKTRRQKSYYSP